MRLFWGILTCLGSILLGSAGAGAESVSGLGNSGLTAGFDAWVTALEAETAPEAAWEYPFAAPRPADLSAEEMKIVLALRRLVQNEDLENLAALADQVIRRQETPPTQMQFWLAYALHRLDRTEASLTQLHHLLQIPNSWENLEKGQRAWVLTATGDLFFRLEKRHEAAVFYTRLAASHLDRLSLWGHYQLAGLDFLARQFAEAGRKYQLVCESEHAGTWREHACSMAELSGRMGRLGKEGEPHVGASD